MTLKHPSAPSAATSDVSVGPRFGLAESAVPRHELPAGEMPPDVAYQVIHDELMLDGNARLNVATFVSTWMEPQAERLIAECLDKNMIEGRIAELGPFSLLTQGDELPVFAFTLKPGIDNLTVFDVSNALRERGWQVPAYTFPENRTDLAALRVVVRRGFTHDLADMLVHDLERQLPRLERQPEPVHDASSGTGFAH